MGNLSERYREELMKILEADGWFIVRQRGSHRQYKHAVKKGLVTVAFHGMNDDVARGTLASVFKQAQIERK